TGNWITRNDKQISRFRIAMSSPDLGALLDNLGYDRAALEGGDTRIEIDAAWNGAPTQFALDRLNGILSLDVTKGRLLDVNPGASGRIFGLLSLQALPRRLKLDFSDLFNKGFAYDQVKGDFTIDSGDAYTNNLYMLAPAARIDIAGRVGLASRDYDQIMTISPEVSTTMPLAGALAGGPVGAAVGAVAAFVAEKLFKTELNQVVNTQYLITGGWSDPTIERIHEEVPK
ncbi:MAG: TIGR02099 family protein, partial [Gammaproteobacteria bacterium]|nr:TIGR02099 family protein [Gammaproteobacteria bacterium]